MKIEIFEWGYDPETNVPKVRNRRHCGRCNRDHNEVPRSRRVSDRDALHTVSRDLRGIRCDILEGNGTRVVLEKVDTLLDHLENFLAEN